MTLCPRCKISCDHSSLIITVCQYYICVRCYNSSFRYAQINSSTVISKIVNNSVRLLCIRIILYSIGTLTFYGKTVSTGYNIENHSLSLADRYTGLKIIIPDIAYSINVLSVFQRNIIVFSLTVRQKFCP